MKSFFVKNIVLALCIMATAMGTYAATADQVLEKVEKKLLSGKAVTVSYQLVSSQGSLDGTLTVQGTKYTMGAGNLSVWFNGRTQWTLNRKAKEVTITNPTAEELSESNPFTIFHGWKQHYTASIASTGKTDYIINLTGKGKNSSVRKATVTVNRQTYAPKSITVVMDNGAKATITVKGISYGKKLPDSFFAYNVKAGKGVEVVDLR